MDRAEEERRDDAAHAVRKIFPPDVAAAVIGEDDDDDAFGALAWHLHRAARAGRDPQDVLAAIPPNDVEFARRATNPAAFVTSRLDYF